MKFLILIENYFNNLLYIIMMEEESRKTMVGLLPVPSLSANSIVTWVTLPFSLTSYCFASLTENFLCSHSGSPVRRSSQPNTCDGNNIVTVVPLHWTATVVAKSRWFPICLWEVKRNPFWKRQWMQRRHCVTLGWRRWGSRKTLTFCYEKKLG